MNYVHSRAIKTDIKKYTSKKARCYDFQVGHGALA